MSKFIIYDYEIFKYNSLQGAIVINEDESEEVFQPWDLNDIKKFYQEHKRDVWVGHNNFSYDDRILDAINHDENPYNVSQKIVNGQYVPNCRSELYSIDLMKLWKNNYSLKLTELICGHDIDTTEVDFNIQTPLTQEQIELTNHYNLSDLKQTLYNFKAFYHMIELRFDMIKEFKLDFNKAFKSSYAMLAAEIFGVKPNKALQFQPVKPKWYSTLRVKNEDVKAYYMNEGFKIAENTLVIKIGDFEIVLGGGGCHGAIKGYHAEKVLYADVGGFYNLIALLYDLLPRSMTKEQKEKYKEKYEYQLELKKQGSKKRQTYKEILLAVIGAMNNEGSPFYDPNTYALVGITGQLFLVDLIEKLDALNGLVKMVQVNTDGIMLELTDWSREEEVRKVLKEWEDRTGFSLKIDYLYDLWQRDVNTYFCKDGEGKIIVKGEAVKNYFYDYEAYSNFSLLNCQEPSIIAKGIVDYFLFQQTPEETVNKYKKDLKLFQYICKQTKAYDYIAYETSNVVTMETSIVKLKNIARAFAYKSNEEIGIVQAYKDNRYGKSSKRRLSKLPDNVFIYNKALNDNAYKNLKDKIDYTYYVKRIYEKIISFMKD